MNYINSGKEAGAKVHLGGDRWGTEGYFIQPTIFTETRPDMRIVQEEIFGPVGVVIKFHDDADVIKQANDTVYGLAAALFTKNIDRALTTARELRAGTAWINCANQLHPQVPFGGFKQSGIGRELGEYALEQYVIFYSSRVWNAGSRVAPPPATPPSRPCTSTSATRSKRRGSREHLQSCAGSVVVSFSSQAVYVLYYRSMCISRHLTGKQREQCTVFLGTLDLRAWGLDVSLIASAESLKL